MAASSGAAAAGRAAIRVRASDTSGKVGGGRLAEPAAVSALTSRGAGRVSLDARGSGLACASRCTVAGRCVGSLGGFGDAVAVVSTGAGGAVRGVEIGRGRFGAGGTGIGAASGGRLTRR